MDVLLNAMVENPGPPHGRAISGSTGGAQSVAQASASAA